MRWHLALTILLVSSSTAIGRRHLVATKRQHAVGRRRAWGDDLVDAFYTAYAFALLWCAQAGAQGARKLPVVLWHGMGDSCCASYSIGEPGELATCTPGSLNLFSSAAMVQVLLRP